jgi:ankyrin repeat protein
MHFPFANRDDVSMSSPCAGCRGTLPGNRLFFSRVLAALACALLAPAAWAQTTAQEDVMFAATRVGNVALFRAMIKAGANITALDDAGNNALVLAATSNHEDMVREVLANHPDLDVRGGLGMTALGIATVRGATLEAQRLLAAGANPDIADANGVSPLASALRLGRGALATSLITAGADPNIADHDGCTPLHIVAESGDAQRVAELLRHGADPNVLDRDRRSPLFLAFFNHHREVAEVLVRRQQTDLALVTQGYSPAFWARQMGYEDLARSIAARLRKG